MTMNGVFGMSAKDTTAQTCGVSRRNVSWSFGAGADAFSDIRLMQEIGAWYPDGALIRITQIAQPRYAAEHIVLDPVMAATSGQD